VSLQVFCSEEISSETLLVLSLKDFSLELSPEGRGLFFNQMSGEILSLNKTGAFIVDNLRNPIAFGILLKKFSEIFDLPRRAAEADLREFLATLGEMKLVQSL